MARGKASTGSELLPQLRGLKRLLKRARLLPHLQRQEFYIKYRQWRADRDENKRWSANASGKPYVLLVRHIQNCPNFYQGFLSWLEINFPDLRSHFRLALMPVPNIKKFRPAVLVPWLQDPIESWSPKVFWQAVALANKAGRLGIPVINQPQKLSNIAKSRTVSILSSLGVRTPRMECIVDPESLNRVQESFPGPFFIRNNLGHGGPILMVQEGDQLEQRSLQEFETPVAIEWIDTRSPDGIYRKYRYQAAGEFGLSVHLLCSPEWEVRGHNKLLTDEARAEEERHIAQNDRNHAIFQKCRQAMGLDFVAFDYAYDIEGRLVIWEANGYPGVFFGPALPELKYREIAVHRIYAAMAGLYLDSAGIAVPPEIDQLRTYAPGSETLVSIFKANPKQ